LTLKKYECDKSLKNVLDIAYKEKFLLKKSKIMVKSIISNVTYTLHYSA